MVAATDAKSVDRSGFWPAAPCSFSCAVLKRRAALAVKLASSLAGARSSAGRQTNVVHGLLRSSASPSQVFEMRRPGCGHVLLSSCLAQAIKVSKVAPLPQREHSGQQLRWARFGRARSCAIRGRRRARERGGSFDEINAGGSNFALQRTAGSLCSLPNRFARRR
jgi:hypothetical protein